MNGRLGSELDGWRVEEYGRSRDGLPLRVFLPAGDGPLAGLLTAAQHGEEADAALLVRRLLERVPGTETRWAVIPVLNPDGLLAGTRQNAAGVDLNRNFPASTWEPDPTFSSPPGIDPEIRVLANRTLQTFGSLRCRASRARCSRCSWSRSARGCRVGRC